MFQMASLGPMLGQVHHFVKFNSGKSAYAEERYSKEALRIYEVLNTRLGISQYVAGNDYGIADISIWPWIARFEWQNIDLTKFPNVFRWYKEISTREAVIKTIYFNGKPAVIPDIEMESIKKMLESPEKIHVFNGIAKGVIVKIESGPFEGIEGIVKSVSDDENTLSVSVQLLNRTISVSIPSDTKVKRIN